MEHARKIRATAFLSALLLAVLPCAWGQAGVALRGTVTDSSAAAIANATVHLINTANNQQQNAQADGQGNYVFPQVAPGTYRLEVEAIGFEQYEQQIQLKAGVPVTINVKMTIGQVQQQVKVQSQSVEDCLAAEARVFPGIGRGLRAIRRGPTGNYYVLTAPGSAVIVYNNGVKIGQVPAQPSPMGSISYGEGLDVDSAGHIYVADRGANAVKIYSADGVLTGRVPVLAPVSVKALSAEEVAVASQFSPHLVDVYDLHGRQMESFGGTSDTDAYLTEKPRAQQKALIDRGWFYGDSSENLFFDMTGAPDPTIRKYDRYGYAAFDITILQNDYSESSLTKIGRRFGSDLRISALSGNGDEASGGLQTSSDDLTNAGGVGHNANTNQQGAAGTTGSRPMMRTAGIPGGGPGGETHDVLPDRHSGFNHEDMGSSIQFNKHPKPPEEKPAIDSLAVEPGTEDLWVAIAGDLIHYDKTGNRLATYCISTVDQGPIDPTAIVIEDDDILLGTDPFGVFEYVRPDKVNLLPSTPAATPAAAAASSPTSAATAATAGTDRASQARPASAAPASAPAHP